MSQTLHFGSILTSILDIAYWLVPCYFFVLLDRFYMPNAVAGTQLCCALDICVLFYAFNQTTIKRTLVLNTCLSLCVVLVLMHYVKTHQFILRKIRNDKVSASTRNLHVFIGFRYLVYDMKFRTWDLSNNYKLTNTCVSQTTNEQYTCHILAHAVNT